MLCKDPNMAGMVCNIVCAWLKTPLLSALHGQNTPVPHHLLAPIKQISIQAGNPKVARSAGRGHFWIHILGYLFKRIVTLTAPRLHTPSHLHVYLHLRRSLQLTSCTAVPAPRPTDLLFSSDRVKYARFSFCIHFVAKANC